MCVACVNVVCGMCRCISEYCVISFVCVCECVFLVCVGSVCGVFVLYVCDCVYGCSILLRGLVGTVCLLWYV